jgi:hypothetical protein
MPKDVEHNFLQSPLLPDVRIPPAKGGESFEQAFDAVISAMEQAGLDPFPLVPAQGLAEAATFSRVVYVDLAGRASLAWVVDAPFEGERVDRLLHDAYSFPPQALFHIYSAHPIPAELTEILSDGPLGRLSRGAIHNLELHSLSVDDAGDTAADAARLVAQSFGRELDLDRPEEALELIDELLLSCRSEAGPSNPGPVPGIAALGLAASEAVRRALPGARFGVDVEAAEPGDDTLPGSSWAFPLDWGETKIEVGRQAFRRYYQGQACSLASCLRRARACMGARVDFRRPRR